MRLCGRRCVACREIFPRDDLFRVMHARLTDRIFWSGCPLLVQSQGRSAYLCHRETCYKSALKGRRLQKSLKHPMGDDMMNQLGQAYENWRVQALAAH